MKTGRCGMIDDGHDHLLPDALLLGSGRKVDRIFGRVAIAHTPTERKSSGKAHDRIVHIGDEKGKALGLTLSDQVSDLCHCLFLGVECRRRLADDDVPDRGDGGCILWAGFANHSVTGPFGVLIVAAMNFVPETGQLSY